MDNFLFYFAVAPPLFFLYLVFLFSKTEKNRELDITLMIFLFGCLSVIPAYYLETAFGYLKPFFLDTNGATRGFIWLKVFIFVLFGVALIEEFCKFMVLKNYALHQKEFRNPYDGIIYGVTASLGFALIENIMYVYAYSSAEESMQVAIVRMFSAIPAHGLMGVFMGYYIGKAKFDKKKQSHFFFYGLLSSISLHTAYDFFLFLPSPNMSLSILTLLVSLCLAIPVIKGSKNRSSTTHHAAIPSVQVSDRSPSTQPHDKTTPVGERQCPNCQMTLSSTMIICYRCGAKFQG